MSKRKTEIDPKEWMMDFGWDGVYTGLIQTVDETQSVFEGRMLDEYQVYELIDYLDALPRPIDDPEAVVRQWCMEQGINFDGE